MIQKIFMALVMLLPALPMVWAIDNLGQRLDRLEGLMHNDFRKEFVCTEARYGNKGLIECVTYEKADTEQ